MILFVVILLILIISALIIQHKRVPKTYGSWLCDIFDVGCCDGSICKCCKVGESTEGCPCPQCTCIGGCPCIDGKCEC